MMKNTLVRPVLLHMCLRDMENNDQYYNILDIFSMLCFFINNIFIFKKTLHFLA